MQDLNDHIRGAWVAQSVEHPTSAQVMISQLVSSSPASGSVMTAQSLEPASDSVSLSCSAPAVIESKSKFLFWTAKEWDAGLKARDG